MGRLGPIRADLTAEPPPRNCCSSGSTGTHHYHVMSCFSLVSRSGFGRDHTDRPMSVSGPAIALSPTGLHASPPRCPLSLTFRQFPEWAGSGALCCPRDPGGGTATGLVLACSELNGFVPSATSPSWR